MTLLIAMRVSDSNAEIFIHEVKAFHENRALHEMKIFLLLVVDGLKPSEFLSLDPILWDSF